MPTLTCKEIETFSSFLSALYAPRNRGELIDHLLATLPELIHADLFGYAEADAQGGHFSSIRSPHPEPVDKLPILTSHLHQHPVLEYWQAHGCTEKAAKVSDFMSSARWRNLPLYTDFLQPEGIEHQMGIALSADANLVKVLSAHRGRGRDFSEQDLFWMTMLRPHVLQAFQNADVTTRLREGGEMLEITRSGEICWSSDNARLLMAAYFGDEYLSRDSLKDPLLRWCQNQEHLLSHPETLLESNHIPSVKACHPALLVRYLRDGEKRFLLFQEHPEQLEQAAYTRIGMSKREAEVLTWVTKGKTNDEIARILSISPFTVKKHMGRIFFYLGVENRTSAAIRARELMAQANAGLSNKPG